MVRQQKAAAGDGGCNNAGAPCPEGFSYTSENNPDVINVKELRTVLEQITDDYAIEKSRWSMEDVSETYPTASSRNGLPSIKEIPSTRKKRCDQPETTPREC